MDEQLPGVELVPLTEEQYEKTYGCLDEGFKLAYSEWVPPEGLSQGGISGLGAGPWLPLMAVVRYLAFGGHEMTRMDRVQKEAHLHCAARALFHAAAQARIIIDGVPHGGTWHKRIEPIVFAAYHYTLKSYDFGNTSIEPDTNPMAFEDSESGLEKCIRLRGEGELRHYSDAMIELASLEKWVAPFIGRHVTKAKDETACRKALVQMMKAAPFDPRPKREVHKEKFSHLGLKPFNRAWEGAVIKAGTPAWSRGGRRRKTACIANQH